MPAYVRCLLLATLYAGGVQFAFLAFLQKPGNPDSEERLRLPGMVDGTGYRPFVFRSALPGAVRLIHGILPTRVSEAVGEAAFNYRPLRKLFEATPAAEERAPTVYLIAYALEFACLFGYVITLRAAIAFFYAPPTWLKDLLPLLGLVSLPVFYRYVNYDYDLPQVFLFTWGLVLLAKRRWRSFYPVLALGAFSKETTLLLVVIHILGHASKMPARLLMAHAAAQLAVLAAVRGLLQFVVFADNPGVPVEVWLDRNWQMLSDPSRWGFLFFHFTWVGHQTLVVPTNYNVLFLVFVPLVVWRWRDKPLLLRRGLWIAPTVLVLGMFYGYVDEMRIYYEVYVVVFLLAAHTICTCTMKETVDKK